MTVQKLAQAIRKDFATNRTRPEDVASISGLSVSTVYKVLAAGNGHQKARIDPVTLQAFARYYSDRGNGAMLNAIASYALGFSVRVECS